MNAALSVCSLVEGASPPTYRRDGGAGAADIRGGEERERRQNGKVEVPDTKTRTGNPNPNRANPSSNPKP